MPFSGSQITRTGPFGLPRQPYPGFAAQVSAAITGTAAAGLTETDVVTGGKTIIITLTSDTWVTAGATFDAQRQNIIDGLDSAQSELTGWNNEVRDNLAVTTVVRTSDTVVTITLSAQAAYDITADETITVTVPASALTTSSSPVIGTPTLSVTADAPVVTQDTGAGRSRRRRRYQVEIDGQVFEAESLAEVELLLQRAKTVIEQVADDVEPDPIRVETGTVVPISKPVIRTDDSRIQPLVSEYRADIEAIYRRISADYEARERVRLRLLEDEEEAVISLLIH